MPKIDLITPGQRRRLKLLRLVAAMACLITGVGVVFAALTHWALGLVALFFAPVVVYLMVLLFETLIPGD